MKKARKMFAPRATPFWSQYPPPQLRGDRQLLHDQKFAHNLFASIPFEQLLPTKALKVTSEMTLNRQEEHSKSEGSKWLSND
jgi:hypothetical protein